MSLHDAVKLGMHFSPPHPPCEECAAWRADAEALAGALAAITRRVPAMGPGDEYRDGQWAALSACAEVARAALARLPAQALTERHALEAKVELLAYTVRALCWASCDRCTTEDACANTALIGLPAQALAERRALEALAEALEVALRGLLDNPYLQAPRDRAFAALDAVRREGGA